MEYEFQLGWNRENDLKTLRYENFKISILWPKHDTKHRRSYGSLIEGLPRSIDGIFTASKLNSGGSHYHNPEVDGAGNKTQFCEEPMITNESLRIEETPPTTTTTPIIATTITTLTITTTTTIKITTTITTVIMITTNSRIEGKKLSELMLPPQLRTKGILKTKGTMETFLCVQDAPCITQEFALLSVRLATKWVI
ncbi:hypothetical protein Tco_0077627 [Tanacetum coccineum]